MKHFTRFVPWMACAAVALVLAGCGKGEFKTAPTRGKVTFNGQPVTGGSLTFKPVAQAAADAGQAKAIIGKPASADIQPDGTFVMTTYEKNDGAVVGKHEVLFSAPVVPYQGEPKPGTPRPTSPFDNLMPKDKNIEIKAGPNDITIELVPKA